VEGNSIWGLSNRFDVGVDGNFLLVIGEFSYSVKDTGIPLAKGMGRYCTIDGRNLRSNLQKSQLSGSLSPEKTTSVLVVYHYKLGHDFCRVAFYPTGDCSQDIKWGRRTVCVNTKGRRH
jgi:hypothetical protein